MSPESRTAPFQLPVVVRARAEAPASWDGYPRWVGPLIAVAAYGLLGLDAIAAGGGR